MANEAILEVIMPVNLSIKEVPESLAERLRARAERNHRSLQGELMAIIEAAAGEGPVAVRTAPGAADQPAAVTPSQGWKTVEQLLAERRAVGWKPHPSLAGLPLGVDIVRADRDSR
jgi:plasmid stability protein